MIDLDTYTTDAVAASIGQTYRVVDYWARTGVLEPTGRAARGSGSRRRYTAEDVAIGQALVHLGRMGAQVPVLRAACSALRDLHRRGDWRGLVYVGPDGELVERPTRCAWALNLSTVAYT